MDPIKSKELIKKASCILSITKSKTPFEKLSLKPKINKYKSN